MIPLLAVSDEFRAVITSWFEQKRSGAELSLAEAHIAEETAEAAKDIAETILAHTPTAGAAQRFLRTDRAYGVADTLLRKCARQILHRASA